MSPCKQLLTVDDNEIDRAIMVHVLGETFPGAEICSVADPRIAAKICADHNFDCAFLDYNMPEMDGLTLANQLRSANAYLPIILVTSVGDEMLVAEALRGGVSDYIVKSRVTPDGVRRIVDRNMRAATQSRVIDQQHEELETFAYALAHDFKQPIRQIITFSQMIADDLRGAESAAVKQHLAFLGHAASRLDKLVEIMVQYTLLNQPPELSDVDLNSVLASVEISLGPLLAERGAELVTPPVAPKVRGNETLMIQVLQNLIVNGLHYNKSAVPRVEVTARGEEGNWVIDVSDNGIGIAPEYLVEIFKPLIRLHAAAEYSGSGLGLTLARKAILAQKGDIWCESTPGHGAVFHVRMPSAEGRREGKRKRQAPTRRMEPGDKPAARRTA